MSWSEEQDRAEIVKLKQLVLDLTGQDYGTVADIVYQTGHSEGHCVEMLKQIDDIRIQASRGKL
jgi:hypothetical protein